MQQQVEGEDTGQQREAALSEARIAVAMEDFDKAREHLARAIDVSPNEPALHAEMAWYTFRCRAIEDSERTRLVEHHLNVARDLDPNSPEPLRTQGMILAAQGNTARARLAFQEGLRIAPGHKATIAALEALDGKGKTALVAFASPAASKADRKLRPGLVVVCVAFVGLALAASAVLAPAVGAGDWDTKLGTRFTLISASHVGNALHIDAGNSWANTPPAKRDEELKLIGIKGKELGLKTIVVLANGRPVAEIHDGVPCLDAKCRATMVSQPTKAGGEKSMMMAPEPKQ